MSRARSRRRRRTGAVLGGQREDGDDGVEDAFGVAGEQVGAGAGDVQLGFGAICAYTLLLESGESAVGVGEGLRGGAAA
ncbi:hypothetical protein ACF9IK_00965 [Kitasatospora hibisci]|uniref:hypothetical protein n=1 Tax=Kitasatospora hibisci TaxID=3369522 RepID=UPI003754A957